MRIVFVTGASGSGKTTLLKNLETAGSIKASFYYFDTIGVPRYETMVRDYGANEEWQRHTIKIWVDRILDEDRRLAILDGQMRLSFIVEACERRNFKDYQIILVDCQGKVQRARLQERGQPELATADMMNWAKYLRDEALHIGARILDTSASSIEQSQNCLKILIEM